MMGFEQRAKAWSARELQGTGWPSIDESRQVRVTKTEDLTPLPEEEWTREQRVYAKYGGPRVVPEREPIPWHIPLATLAYLTGLAGLVYLVSRR